MRPRSLRTAAALGALACAGFVLGSCAFYNSFYLARRYYERATEGEPYIVQRTALSTNQVPNFTRAIDYSKKVIAQYPKSKWVDDAYLLWARALIGSEDPRKSIQLLEEFTTRYPTSPLLSESEFYLGLAYRQARKYERSLKAFDEFLAKEPKHDLTPYAHLERGRVLMALDRPEEAAEAAGRVIEHFQKSKLVPVALLARADARFGQEAYALARADYRALGQRSNDDDERLTFLLREADCLEAARQYDEEMSLLRGALAHLRAPVPPDTTGGRAPIIVFTPGSGIDHYGRLMLRIGTVHLQQGRLEEAIAAYQRVMLDYPRTPIAAEAQYRIGYAYETLGDDFDRARSEYARVKETGGGTTFSDQAALRLAGLERLAQFRSAGGDSVEKKAEAEFLLAELYLFQQDKPERALEHYQKIEQEFPDSAIVAKAITARAWVLGRKLQQKSAADSLLWIVVRQYPATEAQLAARDYLESEGIDVPTDLIRLPPPKVVPRDTTLVPAFDSLASEPTVLPEIPESDSLIGPRPGVGIGAGGARPGLSMPDSTRPLMRPRFDVPRTPSELDSLRAASAARDSAARALTAPRDTVTTPAPRDTTRAPGPPPPNPPAPGPFPPNPPAPGPFPPNPPPAPPDTTSAAPADTTRKPPK